MKIFPHFSVDPSRCYFLLLVVFLSLQISYGQSCPSLYRRYSTQHTFCQPPNRQCQILDRGVKPEEVRKVVQIHNEKRNRIATGKENIGNLPSASDMLEMEWDEELASVAQKHAEQCKTSHDCNECRQIKNFRVGQNIYESWVEGGGVPRPNWKAAIDYWYNEVSNFHKGIINSYNTALATGVIGHFTEVIWSRTFKVGCGYVVYKDGPKFRQLYTCNYGPTGNMRDQPVYSTGKPCGRCPTNSCCGKNCNGRSNFDGLCKILDSKAPKQVRAGNYEYYCDFEQPQSCNYATPAGMKPWQVTHTLSGSYIGIVLRGGESSTINFNTPIRSSNPSCLSIKYRKGPNVAGQLGGSVLQEHFQNIRQSFGFDIPLPTDTVQFMSFGMNLNWNSDLTFSLKFSVLPGFPEQYVEITDIYLQKGSCP